MLSNCERHRNNLFFSYARAPEILEYFRNVARKYELYRYIRLSHRVVNAEWHEDKGIWELRIEDSATGAIFKDSCDFMISASGILK
jgi:cation diffusion facilitator CzcD-associated flavoprotein CzcO